MGETFEVVVYQTSNLTSYCYSEYGDEWRSQKRAKLFIEGAFDQSQHSVDVLTPSNSINAPQEKVNEQFTAISPCTNLEGTFESL